MFISPYSISTLKIFQNNLTLFEQFISVKIKTILVSFFLKKFHTVKKLENLMIGFL